MIFLLPKSAKKFWVMPLVPMKQWIELKGGKKERRGEERDGRDERD
jgi:hypothetical protein